jgi:uncharacterized protein
LTAPAYFDASALVKRYVRETGSAAVSELLESHECVTSVLLPVELRGALRRHSEEGLIDPGELLPLVERLAQDRGHWTLVNLDAEVIAEAEALVSSHSIRALDAIHVGSARVLSTRIGRALLFVTADKKQGDVAEAIGLTVKRIL